MTKVNKSFTVVCHTMTMKNTTLNVKRWYDIKFSEIREQRFLTNFRAFWFADKRIYQPQCKRSSDISSNHWAAIEAVLSDSAKRKTGFLTKIFYWRLAEYESNQRVGYHYTFFSSTPEQLTQKWLAFNSENNEIPFITTNSMSLLSPVNCNHSEMISQKSTIIVYGIRHIAY